MQPPYRPNILPLSESRRTRISNVSDAAGGPFTVSGLKEIQGIGEATFDVNFPVRFFEMPVVSLGAHIGGLTGAVPYVASGSYPTVQSIVASWRTNNGPNTGSPYYLGASIVVLITGQSNQVVTVHYSFSGRAVTYLPTGGGTN